MVNTERESLISENDNNTALNCDCRQEITNSYESLQFWEKPIDIEQYLYPRFVAYNDIEEYRQEREKEKQKKKTARNKQPRRQIIKRNAKASTSK